MNIAEKEYIASLSDKEIVSAILQRNAIVTRLYLYEKFYPLFKARYNKYYTDCESCIEFINEIYVYIMTPRSKSGRCYLASFQFNCRFEHWLGIVVDNYCHQLFKKRPDFNDNMSIDNDRFKEDTISISVEKLNQSDVDSLLQMMHNERYRKLIQYRYLDEKTNEETAKLLDMSMDNYYNKHKLAKEQFKNILRKEGLL